MTRLGGLLPSEPWLRWTLGVVAAVVAFAAATDGISALLPGPSGPTASVYATAPAGVAAYGQLLTAASHRLVELRRSPSVATPAADATMFVLDPGTMAPADATALLRFTRAGGRLVIGGDIASPALSELLKDAPTWTAGGPTSVAVVHRAPADAGVSRVLTVGDGQWTSPGAATPLLGANGGDELLAANVGRGQIDLLADVAPLENAMLGRADNALLGLDLAGPPTRPVVFLETIHGFGSASGLSALPTRWKWALLGALLASIVFALAHARRLGAADPQAPPSVPERALYVHSLAATLSRTRGSHAAAERVQQEALALYQRLGGGSNQDEEARNRTLAERTGLDPSDFAALRTTPRDDASVLRSGRTLRQLRKLRR